MITAQNRLRSRRSTFNFPSYHRGLYNTFLSRGLQWKREVLVDRSAVHVYESVRMCVSVCVCVIARVDWQVSSQSPLALADFIKLTSVHWTK